MRALAEPLDVRWRSREPYPLLEVRNPLRGTRYLVLLPAYPDRESALCTCTDFARRGLGDCKHIESAWRWLGSRSETDDPLPAVEERPAPPAVWEEVDRRLRGDPPLELRDIRALGAPGRVLFERRSEG